MKLERERRSEADGFKRMAFLVEDVAELSGVVEQQQQQGRRKLLGKKMI